jgi:hypothetical protein
MPSHLIAPIVKIPRRTDIPGIAEHSRGRGGVKAALRAPPSGQRVLTPLLVPRQIIPISGECHQKAEELNREVSDARRLRESRGNRFLVGSLRRRGSSTNNTCLRRARKSCAFVKAFLGTFGGISTKQVLVTVTPTPSSTSSHLVQTLVCPPSGCS